MLRHNSDATGRQRGRAINLQQRDKAFAQEALEKRQRLQRRVERRALEHQVLVEATELEKELEARRCKLCDLLRAEAWGLGYANWFERRCGRCWVEQADTLAKQRHELLPAPGARSELRPGSAAASIQQGAAIPSSASGQQGTALGGGGNTAQFGGPSAAETLGDIPADRIDDAIAALRARDPDRLMQLLDARTLARHLGLPVDDMAAAQQHANSVPPPEEPDGNHYYHDAILGALAVGQADEGAGSPTVSRRPDGDGEEQDEACSVGPAASSAVAEADFPGGTHRLRHANRDASPLRFAPDDTATGGMDMGGFSGFHRNESGATRPRAGREQPLEGAQQEPNQQGAETCSNEVHAAPGSGLVPSGHQPQPDGAEVSATAGSGGKRDEARRGLKVAGYQAELRPLPSKPRSIPSSEADLEAALKEAEHLIVFGRTQRLRSEALFHSHQLRSALADLRLLDRKGRKAQAVHRNGMRLDTRDELGVKRIIREGRPEQPPSPTKLRHILQPETFYLDPPKRAPRWLEHIHPSRANPAKAVDVVAWRPPSATVPPPNHTEGMRSAGDWGEYRYDWDLARIRSMPVDDYRTVVRKEREYRAAWASLQARAHVAAGVTPMQPPTGGTPEGA